MGKYIVNKTATGYTFHLKADNGETITSSEVYETETSANNGIISVRMNAPIAGVEDQTIRDYEILKNPKFVIPKDIAGEFRFRLQARNGEVIAVSEGYVTKEGCKNGIESVRKNSVGNILEHSF